MMLFSPLSSPLLLSADACELTLDPNTADKYLSLSEGNRKMTCVIKEHPTHPQTFNRWYQVLCREGQSGRCYWEAEWSGIRACISVAYKSIERKWDDDSALRLHDKSCGLYCLPDSYTAWHNNECADIPAPPSRSGRVGVYQDWPA